MEAKANFKKERKFNLSLLLILLLAAFLRLWHLSYMSFWTDEGISFRVSSLQPYEILKTAAADVHPPFYYLFLHYWIQFFGRSEIIIRLLSALAGILSVIVVYYIARELLGERAAFFTALLAAFSPYWIWYSQEARSYSLLLLLSLISVWAFLCFLRKDSPLIVLIYFLASLAALYTHYYFFLILLFENIYFWLSLNENRKLWKRWFFIQLLLVIFYLPWAFIALFQFKEGMARIFDPLTAFPKMVLLFSLGRTLDFFRLGKVIHMVKESYLLDYAVIGAGALAFGFLFVKGILEMKPASRKIVVLWLSVVAVPFLLSFLKPIWDTKSLIVLSPAYFMAIGYGLSSLTRKDVLALASLLLVFSMGLPLYNYYFYKVSWKEDFKGVVETIREGDKEGEWILIHPGYMIDAFRYYDGWEREEVLLLPGNFESKEEARRILESSIATAPGVWYVLSAYPPIDPKRHAKRCLEDRFELEKDWNFSGLHLFHYIKKGESMIQ